MKNTLEHLYILQVITVTFLLIACEHIAHTYIHTCTYVRTHKLELEEISLHHGKESGFSRNLVLVLEYSMEMSNLCDNKSILSTTSSKE